MARRQFRRPKNANAAAPNDLTPPVVAEESPLGPVEKAAVDVLTEGVEVAATPPPVTSREPTLAELNRQSWAIDDQHAAKRREAEEAINKVAGPLLTGVQRGRGRLRRLQKPIRPVVR